MFDRIFVFLGPTPHSNSSNNLRINGPTTSESLNVPPSQSSGARARTSDSNLSSPQSSSNGRIRVRTPGRGSAAATGSSSSPASRSGASPSSRAEGATAAGMFIKLNWKKISAWYLNVDKKCFSKTGIWRGHLLLDFTGTADFEFHIP